MWEESSERSWREMAFLFWGEERVRIWIWPRWGAGRVWDLRRGVVGGVE